jgi:hypothetical protein
LALTRVGKEKAESLKLKLKLRAGTHYVFLLFRFLIFFIALGGRKSGVSEREGNGGLVRCFPLFFLLNTYSPKH